MSAQADIRKWFMKKPDQNKVKNEDSDKISTDVGGAASKYKKESKFFAGDVAGTKTTTPSKVDKSKLKLEKKSADGGKRKSGEGVHSLASQENGSPPKKPRMVIPAPDEPSVKGSSKIGTPREQKHKGASSKPPSAAKGRGSGKFVIIDDDEDLDYKNFQDETVKTPSRTPTTTAGRGRGRPPSTPDVKSTPQKSAQTPHTIGRGRGKPTDDTNGETKTPAGRGRGRGGGGGFGGPPWGGQGVPPHKGEKEVPQGAEDALAGFTFVISGTLDSLEREEAELLIKSHGGRVTGSVSKKTSYLLADEDVGGVKSKKAKELGVKFLTEDELFEMIKASKPKTSLSKPVDASKTSTSRTPNTKGGTVPASGVPSAVRLSKTDTRMKALPPPSKSGQGGQESQAWPAKHAPKSSADIIGNQGIVKQLRDWLQNWEANFGHVGGRGAKGKKRVAASSSPDLKKAVLLSGTPGIGKTTTARLVCKELGFEVLEVNASDSRGKSDSNVKKGMDGKTANTIKEMVDNESISFTGKGITHTQKSALIMDEVDGMSGGDRGGVADLIASIKSSRVPIICICNDRYSQKLKSLLNYCLVLNYRKPTKQQMAKRLILIAKAEGLQVTENTLEEIAERSNGDMRTSLNQLQYMSLRTSALSFSDVHARLVASAKDEAITPFSAAEKLLGFEGRSLRMDERVDMHMSDADLVPLIVQENYLNYIPSEANRDSTGLIHMDRAARAAMSIAEGDIVNGQIRRRNQWQLSQTSAFLSSVIPAALMQGQRKEFEGGRYNFNRFPAWLGKQSNYKKKVRLLEDVHIHLLASRICEPTRESIRLNYVPVLLVNITHPLRHLPKDAAVDQVVNLMNEYSLSQEDYDTIMEVSEFKGHPDPLEGVQAAVKSALTKTYKSRIQDRVVRSADLLPPMALPGQKKAFKKPKRLVLDEAEIGDGDSEVIKEEELLLSDEEGEGDADNEEDGENIESLMSSHGTTKVTLDRADQPKGTKGRGAASKSKASDSKTPSKTPRKNKQDGNKATPSSAKRRK